ncbi:MAG: hypothetical protein Q4C14_04845 [Bacillota bacterium]|nr:hypothetical protein [Bacillota bacterium]
MKPDLSRYAPPGINIKSEINFFTGLLSCVSVFSFAYFLNRYLSCRSSLFVQSLNTKTVFPGAQIENFRYVLGTSLYVFAAAAVCMLFLIIIHYSYHYKDSRSIYLMKRLPNPGELHRRCLTLPILAALICLAAGFIALVIYYAIYMNFTPGQCIPPNQWQKIWRF